MTQLFNHQINANLETVIDQNHKIPTINAQTFSRVDQSKISQIDHYYHPNKSYIQSIYFSSKDSSDNDQVPFHFSIFHIMETFE